MAGYQELNEKIKDLQQQTRFCLNNYDYHHKNNEQQILDEQQTKLYRSAKIFDGFMHNLHDLKKTIQQANAECDKIDMLMRNYGVKGSADHGADCSNKANNEHDGEYSDENDKENEEEEHHSDSSY